MDIKRNGKSIEIEIKNPYLKAIIILIVGVFIILFVVALMSFDRFLKSLGRKGLIKTTDRKTDFILSREMPEKRPVNKSL